MLRVRARSLALGPGGHSLLGLPILLLALVSGSGCHLAEAKAWNLEQLHEPDGSPRWHGDVRSDIGFLARRPLEVLLGQQGTALKEKSERIEDPYGECLENLRGLQKASSSDPRVLALQTALFSWLAVDDTYLLSREVAAEALGSVGRALGITELKPLPDTGASPEEVASLLSSLIRAARPVLEDDPLASQIELSGACDEVRAQTRNFQGERRFFSALTTLLGGGAFEAPLARPLADLHRELGRSVVAHAILTAQGDREGRVRAAALKSAVEILGTLGASDLEFGLSDPSPDVVRTTLLLIDAHGLPDDADKREGWLTRIVELTQSLEGPVTVAACETLSILYPERGRELRPEIWVTWWNERMRAASGS